MSIQVLGDPWNPTTGCTKISAGCKNCYAEAMANRWQHAGNKRYVNGFNLTLHPDSVDIPRKRKSPRTYFVDSMSDLFHQDIPLDFIQSVFKTMNECTQHTFQILTKRSGILVQHAPLLTWTPNIWMGVSVENQSAASRIDDLRNVPATIRFLSIEPLIGPLNNLNLDGIHWVLVAGESGPGWRQMDLQWVRDIRDQCKKQNVKFFFKQFADLHPEKLGRKLDGVEWSEMPVVKQPSAAPTTAPPLPVLKLKVPFTPSRIFVKTQSRRSPRTKLYLKNILGHNPNAQITYLKSKFAYPGGLNARQKYEYARGTVIIGERVEDFVRTFPSPGDIVESFETVGNAVWMCPSGCEFCYLQLTRPAETTFYTNFKKLERELEIAPFAHATILTIWSMISFAAEKPFLKIPENLMEVSDWVRNHFIQTRINSHKRALSFLFGKLKQIFRQLKKKNPKYLGINEREFLVDKNRLETLYNENLKHPLWINFCEFTDLPAVEHLTGDIDYLMSLLPKYKELRMKFRTKSANVEAFTRAQGFNRVIVTMNVDPQPVINKYEHGTASMDERIEAVSKLQAGNGFAVRIALEPVFYSADWKKEYSEMIDKLFSKADPKKIDQVAIGFPRYRLQLRSMISKHYPHTSLFEPEQNLQPPETKLDARLRYAYDRRTEMVKQLMEMFANYSVKNISLGAENPKLWDMVGLDKTNEISSTVYQFQETNSKEPASMKPDTNAKTPQPKKPEKKVATQPSTPELRVTSEFLAAYEFIQQSMEEIDIERFAQADADLEDVLSPEYEELGSSWLDIPSLRLNEALNGHRTWFPTKLVGFVTLVGLPHPLDTQEGQMSVAHLQITDLDNQTIDCLRIPIELLDKSSKSWNKGRRLLCLLGTVVPIAIPRSNRRVETTYRFYLKRISEHVTAADLITDRPTQLKPMKTPAIPKLKIPAGKIMFPVDAPWYRIAGILHEAKKRNITQNPILQYIKDKVARELKIKSLNSSAQELGLAIEFCILQAFSQEKDIYSYKLHSLLIGPPNVGKGFIPRIAKSINVAYEELPSNSPKLTSAGLVAYVKQKSKKNISVPGILPKISGGTVAFQDFHAVSGSKRQDVFSIFSKMMEDGTVIDATSAHETHDAVVAVHVDTNRYSQVYRGQQFNSYTDLDIPMHILSRFDLILEIPKNAARQTETALAIAETRVLAGARNSKQPDDWARELRMIIAYLRSRFDTVYFNEKVNNYIGKKLVDAVKPYAHLPYFKDNYEDMQIRVSRSVLKLVRAIACANQTTEATKEHVDYAMRFVAEKIKFIASIDFHDITRIQDSDPNTARRSLIMRHFGGKQFNITELKASIDKLTGTEVTEKTYYDDLAKIGGKRVKQGLWSLKRET